MDFTRRRFILGTATFAGASGLFLAGCRAKGAAGPAGLRAPAQFTRYDVTSDMGQRMLASYQTGTSAHPVVEDQITRTGRASAAAARRRTGAVGHRGAAPGG